MRRNLFLLLFLIVSFNAYSQFQLGLKASPTIATNRITSDSDSLKFNTDGVGLRFTVGPFADIQFKENYFISTGIFLVAKRSAFEVNNKNTGFSKSESYNLHYIQIPLDLKLYTNEIALDKRIYFNVGATMEFNVKEKAEEESNYYVNDFKLFDSSVQIGFGLDYKIGLNTSVFGGFSYHRGLINAVSKQIKMDDKLVIKNDYIGLDFGIKF